MKYRKAFALGVQNTLVYRWNFLLKSLLGLVPVAGALYLWSALYRARGGAAVSGYDFSQMVTYFVLTLVAESLITPAEEEWQISADIKDGRVSAYLLKPIEYPVFRLVLYPAARLVSTAVTLVPITIIVAIVWSHLVLPPNATAWLAGALSLALAGLLQFFVSFAVATLAFWLLEISTLVFIVFSFEYFLSGRLFPLDLMPPYFRIVSEWLPFQYEMYFPIAILLGKIDGTALWRGLAIQAAWVILGWLGCRWLWSCGLRRYQAVGG